MKSVALVVLLSAAAVATGADRDLQTSISLDSICTDLLNAGLGAALPNVVGGDDSPVKCKCDPSLYPKMSVKLACESKDAVCLRSDFICGMPNMEVKLDISAIMDGKSDPLSFDTCFDNVILAGTIPVIELFGPLCFSLVQTLLDTLRNNGDDSPAPKNSTSAATGVVQAESTQTCIATFNNQECRSCSVCDSGKGLDFDCTNIEEGLISNQCVDMNLPSQVRDVYHPDKIVSV